MKNRSVLVMAGLAISACASMASAQVIQYGDKDLCNTGTYSTDPVLGATLVGLAAAVVTPGAPAVGHGFPFSPDAGDYAGTDQIYVGSVQTGNSDGYSGFSGRKNGAQVFNLDYSSLVADGQLVDTFTLGLGLDDFQQPQFGQPYIVRVNGEEYKPLTALIAGVDQTGSGDTVLLDRASGLTVDERACVDAVDRSGRRGVGWLGDGLPDGGRDDGSDAGRWACGRGWVAGVASSSVS